MKTFILILSLLSLQAHACDYVEQEKTARIKIAHRAKSQGARSYAIINQVSENSGTRFKYVFVGQDETHYAGFYIIEPGSCFTVEQGYSSTPGTPINY